MRHAIDPTVDCVFKAILGKEANKNLLIHFLNAILQLRGAARIVEVVIANPYNEREFVRGEARHRGCQSLRPAGPPVSNRDSTGDPCRA